MPTTATHAQEVYREEEILATDRPEAWAMNYFTATTFLTAFGATPRLAPGQWAGAVELGEIPRLSQDQRTVGFNGFKNEDLNKAPVFGRARVSLGLPAGWIVELAYTPPITLNGLQAHDLFAAGIGRRLIDRMHLSWSGRVFGQHGSATGDITCPAELAGVSDIDANPYGCQAASEDRVSLNYYGADSTIAWSQGAWQWHLTGGVVRTEPEVQVDALTYDVLDRSHLIAHDWVPYFAAGTARDLGTHWQVGMEVLHVPLKVQREPDSGREDDPLTSLRLRVVYRFRP